MVEDVEEFGTKLQTNPFGQMELSTNREVRLPSTEPTDHIPT
jgi:hypothetical protein